jgi:hypothetical protein
MNSAGNSGAPASEVFRLLGIALSSPTDVSRMSATDLDLTLRVARRVRLLGLLAYRLDKENLIDGFPAPAAEQLNSALAGADTRARLARWELDRIAWAFSDDPSIEILALKGAAYLLLNLPNAAGRYFADVDLLVAEQDLDVAETCLTQRNWNSAKLSDYDQHFYRVWSHEIPPMVHAEREVEVDLHHNIIPRTARLKPPATRLLERASAIPGSRFRALAPVDIVLHAMTHLMFASDLADALRDLVDIDILLRHFSGQDAEFWDDLLRRAELLDLSRPLFYALRYTHRFLDTPVPAAILKAAARKGPLGIIVWIMDRLVPRALYPQHPDRPSVMTDLARLLLYIRLHWISMPPLLLVRHLTYKFVVRHGLLPARFRRTAE